MAKPHDADPGAPKHRPLPSVDMALLPHELRALRVRQAMVAVLGLMLVAAALGLTVARPWLSSLVHEGEAAITDEPWPGERPRAPATGEQPAFDPALAASAAKPAQAAAPAPPDAPAPQPAIALAAAGNEPAAMAAAAEPAAEPPAAAAASQRPSGTTRSVRPFGQARGFRDALVKAGASGADADALIAAFAKLVDFRHAQPEDELVLERSPSGALLALEYRASITERYRAERGADGHFKAARVHVEVEHHRIAKGGYLSDSLGQALQALGLGPGVAGMFVEAFEGKIDFKKQARQGDSFKLLLEEDRIEGHSLGYSRVHALEYKGARGEMRAFWFEPSPGKGEFYDENGRALHGGWLRTPLRYDHISSGFDMHRRHPILKRIMPHQGIDYAAAPGTTVWAAADGVVSFAGRRGPNGNLIAIKHGGGFETFYAHLSRIARGIKRGVHVKQRQPIGAVGSTGRSTGPHLHFALKRRGTLIDPAPQLNGPGKPLPASLLPKFKHQVAALKRELAAIALAPAPAPAAAQQSDDFHDDSVDL